MSKTWVIAGDTGWSLESKTMDVEKILRKIGRRFIGGFGTKKSSAKSGGLPHQGSKEVARRLKQEMKLNARKAGE